MASSRDIGKPLACRILLSAQQPLWRQAQALGIDWLSASEQLRLDSLRQPARRNEFMACRYALRQLLSSDISQISQWKLNSEAGAAPKIHSSPRQALCADWCLSLSHSGPYVVCAAAPQAIGVDMELLVSGRMRSSIPEMAALMCSSAEWQQIQTLESDAAQRACLLRYWSLKEAFFKYAATGMDFVQLPRITCSLLADCQQIPRAHARVWEGRTASGLAVVLTVCMQQPLEVCALQIDADVQWHDITDWGLALS